MTTTPSDPLAPQSETFSHLNSSLTFKIRKVLRYIALEGVSMTLGKVRAQHHLARTEGFDGDKWLNPACRTLDDPARFVGIIGCGKFSHSIVSLNLAKIGSKFLRATFDASRARSRGLCRDYSGAYAAGSVEQLIADPNIKLVYITSNHASHAEYAIQCLDAGKNVHIEKPHVVNDDQLERLAAAQARNPNNLVFLGFNRPHSPHIRRIKDAFSKQTGAIMINWFVTGHAMAADDWYYNPAEGGRILGNLCHWTDLTLSLVGVENAFPCEVFPTSAPENKSDFCVGIKFRDGSMVAFTFSAKGYSFEGVHETLNAQRGEAIVNMTDFLTSTVEVLDKKQKFKTRHRKRGHEQNISNSYISTKHNDPTRAVSHAYSIATAKLFLGVKKSIEAGHPLRIDL